MSSSTQCFLSCCPIILCVWSLSCYLMTVRWLLYRYPQSWVPGKKVGEGENSKDLLLGSPAFLSGKVKDFYLSSIGITGFYGHLITEELGVWASFPSLFSLVEEGRYLRKDFEWTNVLDLSHPSILSHILYIQQCAITLQWHRFYPHFSDRETEADWG